ncbi:unnamed protein product [Orchesella dallaii]|uniref:Uncharacterized protein n=1 Tax=Orchesella dallaii TaxID=48710 RepID=A0ABP1S9J8_9HEXA
MVWKLSLYLNVLAITFNLKIQVDCEVTFLLPHLNWLKNFDNCFNFVLAFPDVQLFPNSKNELPSDNVPYAYYSKFRLINFVPPIQFNRWTYCQTFSVIINTEFSSSLHSNLWQFPYLLRGIGFNDAHFCLPFGFDCTIPTESKSLNDRPLIKHSLFIFYIIPGFASNHNFFSLKFERINKNPYFQIPSRITFPVEETRDGNFTYLIAKNNCYEITYLCNYCTNHRIPYKKYPYTDITTPCVSNDYRNVLFQLHTNATGNGKNVTYFRWFARTDRSGFRESRSEKLTVQTQNLRSAVEILRKRPKLDQIILSIVFEEVKVFENLTKAHEGRGVLAVGSHQGVGHRFGVLKTDSKSFNFLTCYGRKFVDPFVFVRSFKTQVWIFLLFSILLTPLIIRFTYKKTRRNVHGFNERILETESSVVVIIIMSVLLDSVVNTNELQRHKKLRVFLAAWLLTSIVISNAYKGDHFSKATAPAEVYRVEQFDQLTGFQLFSEVVCPEADLDLFPLSLWCTKFGTRLFDTLTENWGSNFIQLIQAADKRSSDTDLSFLQNITFKLKRDELNAHLLFQARNAPRHINTDSVAELIGECNRTAYVGSQEEIVRLYKTLLENGEKDVYYGKAQFLDKSTVWYAQESGGYYMKKRISYLGESGIYNFWKRMIKKSYQDIINRSAVDMDSKGPISLRSNIIVIFYLFGVAHIFTTTSFIVEWLTRRYSKHYSHTYW